MPSGKGLLQMAVGLMAGIIVGVGGLALTNQTRPAAIVIEPAAPTPLPTLTPTPGPIMVYINGEVVQPNLYELSAAARVVDLIEIAGGFTAQAQQDVVNLALPLSDGMQIYVPALNEPGVAQPPVVSGPNLAEGTGGGMVAAAERVNINQADEQELQLLPGVGPAMAQRIIEYRESSGPFTSIEEITNVSGIGPTRLEQLRDLITVGE
ncbi:MAG: helix-hairpin-helix domain-containing protein [Chloroflexota bacterium]